jgi:hypothetical protein
MLEACHTIVDAAPRMKLARYSINVLRRWMRKYQ